MTLRRTPRHQRLTTEEAVKYKAVRDLIAEELPDLIARHHERAATLDQRQELPEQWQVGREAKRTTL